jgi:hypothetical protein
VVGGGSENVGDADVVGIAVLTAGGAPLPRAGVVVLVVVEGPVAPAVGGGKTVVVGGVGPDAGSAPVVTGIQGSAVG